MSLWADILRWAHVIGATVLFGTGAGIAFFMLMAQRTGRAELVAHVADTVVIADTIFTATAVIVGAISLYYTVKWQKEPAKTVGATSPLTLEPVLGLGGGGLRGTF